MHATRFFEQKLAVLAGESRLRALIPRAGRDFASNDYLALSTHPRLRAALIEALQEGVAVGSGGSRLLRGNDPEHEALEEEAAAFFGSEASLFFSSGFAANTTLFSTLPQRGDLIVYDALIHASAHEGMRLSAAERISARHNDAEHFARRISTWRQRGGVGQVWIAVESLYSMDGDKAPLDALMAIATVHEAMLIVDEAHATGVFGRDGAGLAAPWQGQPNLISLHTCGKALGCEGALVASSALVREYLVNQGRGFIFSTAPSPLMARAARVALKLCHDEPENRAQLHTLVGYAGDRLAPYGVTASGSQIMPLIVGEDAPTMALAQALQHCGHDIRGIRPPTVPKGTGRLRIAISRHIDKPDIDQLAFDLGELQKRHG